MDNYYESKKKQGLIFTQKNLNPEAPLSALDPDYECKLIYAPDDGPSYWSHLSCRYRTYEEQQQFIASGCIDRKLPPLSKAGNPVAEQKRQSCGFKCTGADVIIGGRQKMEGRHYGM